MRTLGILRFVVVGAIGFGAGVLIAGAGLLIPVGGAIGGDSPSWLPPTGGVGGASLGATLGYLESRKLAGQGRPRVR